MPTRRLGTKQEAQSRGLAMETSAPRGGDATRIVVATFGVITAFAGIEHGIGEMLQGPVAPTSLIIESWPDAEAFEILAGEPAMTVVPNLLVTGVLTVIVSLAVAVWAVAFADRRYGGSVLVALSLVLLLVGGGFGPPLLGIVLGIGASRIGAASRRPPGPLGHALAKAWVLILGVGVAAYLGLFPGTVLLSVVTEVSEGVVYGLAAVAFGGAIASLVAARAADRVAMAQLPHREVGAGSRAMLQGG
jgi:hypothetical protein